MNGIGPAGAIQSADSAIVTGTPVGKPVASPITASAGDGHIVLTWAVPQRAALPGYITRYEYRYSTDGGSTWNPDWTTVPGSGAGTVSHTIAGLTNGTGYTIQIRAVGNGGNSETQNTNATSSAGPSKPGGFTAIGDGQASVAWTDPSDATITGYQYRVKNGGGYGAWTSIPGSTTTTGYTVTGLANGNTYTFQIRALNGAPGALSEEVAATLVPAAVTISAVILQPADGGTEVTVA